MQVCHVIALVCVVLETVYGQGAGRAIPIATENFIIDLFQRINPRIRYDTTNFLVDLSGNYANCDFIGSKLHRTIDRRTPEDNLSIGLIQDYAYGSETHTKAVDEYLRPVFDSWVYESNSVPGAAEQIRRADRFGCSVRPGCGGQLSVACLFTPSRTGPPPPTRGPTRPPRPPPRTTPPAIINTRPPGEPKALAFTPEQYAEAESLTKQKWDGSHFLENLSGFETRCDMVDRKYHSFPYAIAEAEGRGKEVIGLFGFAPNRGSTPIALLEILKQMKDIQSKEVGCSLIPDCMVDVGFDHEMWVVVSCVFEI